MQTTLQHVAKTVEEVEKQMHEIGKETAQLLHKTNALADDVHKKAESLQGVFDAVKQVGVTVQTFSDSISKTLTTNEKKNYTSHSMGTNACRNMDKMERETKIRRVSYG